jgi:hypothetical protein
MKKTMCAMIIALSCLLLLSQVAEAQSAKYISGDDWFGCTTKEELRKIIQYVIQEDEQAYKKALTAGVYTGSVTLFKKGEEVFIIETDIMSGFVKVRRKGEIKEYWTHIDAVE